MPLGASVIAVTATDKDDGPDNRLTYTVRDSQTFYMDSIYAAGTGVLKIAQVTS